MIRWNVAERARKQGITTAYQLAEKAGLTLPVAYRVWSGAELERIDVATLQALAKAFRVKPWLFLDYEP